MQDSPENIPSAPVVEQRKRSCLVEAFVVMGLVAIVVAIGVPNFLKTPTGRQEKACVNQLRQIEAAKKQWAIEHHKKPGDPVVEEEVDAYLRGSARPVCPASGVYTYNPVGVKPTCSRGAEFSHTL